MLYWIVTGCSARRAACEFLRNSCPAPWIAVRNAALVDGMGDQ